ncbi:adenosylcobinamide-GDP ribazoletransferase [Granulibacter bethesdensis]|uniref:adenosylcobinamide-GDP ribazoletransferase n=1 Tax=Granulibacter bethesdensis TaxID=364410 RepID=UPI0009340C60|nr:adenosylcobinamide-GDP ribazoletransferase [Granulibacter bethesdensis]
MGWLNDRFREIAAAVMVLTRLPFLHFEHSFPAMASAAWAFPLVGGMLGLMIGCVQIMLIRLCGMPSWPAAVICVALGVLMTGALHEDGLADFADAAGGHTTEKKLMIMRDSRIGSFGAVSIVLSLMIRTACIASLTPGGYALGAIISSMAMSRFCVLLIPCFLHPARPEGLGAMMAGIGPVQLAMAAIPTVVLASLAGIHGWLAFLTALLSAWLVGCYARRTLGGFTGDVLGATEQCAVCVAFLVMVCG